MNILDQIVENKKKEIKHSNFALNSEFKHIIGKHSLSKKFQNNILHPKIGDIGLIAEIKMKSPSGGILGTEIMVEKKVKEYKQAGADAISVVTDEKFFGGSLELIKKIKTHGSLPIFRKDFIIDESQIFESAVYEVDAVLLIARIVTPTQLQRFVDTTLQLRIEPVVEVYDENDLKNALKTNAKFIAVNARDLQTFKIDIEKACQLGRQIPKEKNFIGFSGVNTREDVNMYKLSGAKAVLVGTSLMKRNDVVDYIQQLKA